MLTYAFRDNRWPQKLGALVMIGCIPGLNILAWVGYQQSIAYNIAHRVPTPLPTWDDWADILIRGLITVTASGVYWLPVIFLALVSLLPGMRSIALLTLLGACVVCLILSIGHVRYARSDLPGSYQWADWRTMLSPTKFSATIPVAYAIGFVIQTVVIMVAVLLTPVAILTLIGPMIIWSAVSVINGYVLGQIAAKSNSESAPK